METKSEFMECVDILIWKEHKYDFQELPEKDRFELLCLYLSSELNQESKDDYLLRMLIDTTTEEKYDIKNKIIEDMETLYSQKVNEFHWETGTPNQSDFDPLLENTLHNRAELKGRL